jgi:putative SOS response-associated peptidase YedK
MCGKFTALATYREVVEFSQPLTSDSAGGSGDGDEGDAGAGEIYTYRVGGQLPVIIKDPDLGKRRVVQMRWGFPDSRDWRRPRPIHARAETIDQREAFREAFLECQTGIVIFDTFNEGEEAKTSGGKPKTIQWTVTPRPSRPRGFPFLWRRFEIPELPAPILCCVMVTVPASLLVREKIKPKEEDPRQPAIFEDAGDWAPWLGEANATPAERKALLRTVEGVSWEAFPEPPKSRKR